MGRKASAPAGADGASPDGLRDEVRAFASQLGFAASADGGGAGSFEYDDFAPAKAQQRPPAAAAAAAGKDAKKAAKQQQQQQGQQPKQQQQHRNKKQQQQQEQQQQRTKPGGGARGDGGIKPRGGGRAGSGADADAAAAATAAAAADAAVRERGWVDSVGPRPGEASGRSLLAATGAGGASWHAAAAALSPLPADALARAPLSAAAAAEARAAAERLLEREAAAFERELGKRNAADAKWLAQVRRSGTTADRVAALALLVQESAPANVRALDGLLNMMAKRKGGKGVVVSAMGALVELFATALLPDRRLRVLEQQPLQALPPGRAGEPRLLLWAAEDAIKARYSQFITLLESATLDPLEHVKDRATKAVATLLAAKPEGEARLLAALVNKLGDPARRSASGAAYLIGRLLGEHPRMKPVVVREVERFVFRPGQPDRAVYYAAVTLNQLALSARPDEGGPDLARKLVDVYFRLFGLILEGKIGQAASLQRAAEAKAAAGGARHKGKGKTAKGKGKPGGKQQQAQQQQQQQQQQQPAESAAAALDARLLAALIAGVRRAFPYVPAADVEPLVEARGDALFRLAAAAPFPVALQALMLLFQLMSGRNAVSERFYRSLYAALLADGARAGSSAPQLLSLVFKAMKADPSARRCAAFAKRLLQVAAAAPPSWAAAALLLVSEVLRAQPALWSGVQQPEDAGDGEERFVDARDDGDEGGAGNGNGAAGAGGVSSSSDDDDAGAGGADTARRGGGGGKAPAKGAAAGPSGNNGGGSIVDVEALPPWPREDGYDMRKREPLYAHAEAVCWWELLPLASHAHPSVAAFARSLLAGAHVAFTGDPLRDLALPAFLDKFIQRKPKAHARGSSLMQPLPRAALGAAGPAPAEGAAFAALEEAAVDPSDVFFHRFANLASQRARRAAKDARAAAAAGSDSDGEGGGGADSDAEGSLPSDEVDRLLDGDQGATGGGGGGGGEYDYDALMDAMAGGAAERGEGEGGGGDDDDSGSGGGSDSDDADVEEGDEGESGSEPASGASEEEEEDEDKDGSSGGDEGEPVASDDALDFDDSDGSGGSGASSDAGPSGDSSLTDSGTGDDEDYVMWDGATAAAEEGGAGGRNKRKRAGDAKGGAAGEAADDDDLDGVALGDLPSPSGSEDDDEEQEEGDGSGSEDGEGGSEENDDPDLDGLDLDDILAASGSGSDDDDDGSGSGEEEEEEEEEDEEEEEEERPAARGQKRRGGGGGGGDWLASLASADDYAAEIEKAMARADKGDGDGAGGGGGSDSDGDDAPAQKRARGGGRGGRGGRGGAASSGGGRRGGGGRGRGGRR